VVGKQQAYRKYLKKMEGFRMNGLLTMLCRQEYAYVIEHSQRATILIAIQGRNEEYTPYCPGLSVHISWHVRG